MTAIIINKTDFTEADALDLQMVNWLAKADYKHKKLCYDFVKTPLLQMYGTNDGYDMQYFERESWDEFDDDPYSSHWHILQRVALGGLVFHQPTNEFRYEQWHYTVSKQSEQFDYFKAQCRADTIKGISEQPKDFDKKAAIKSLRRLIRKFYAQLRAFNKKPKRNGFDKFPFAAPRFDGWSDKFTGWTIRVPNDVAVCSSCGSKIQIRVDCSDVNRYLTDGFYKFEYFAKCDEYHFRWHGLYAECEKAKWESMRHSWIDKPNKPDRNENIWADSSSLGSSKLCPD